MCCLGSWHQGNPWADLDALAVAVAPGGAERRPGALWDNKEPVSRYKKTSKVQNRQEGCGRSRKWHPRTPGSNGLPLLVPVRIHLQPIRKRIHLSRPRIR